MPKQNHASAVVSVCRYAVLWHLHVVTHRPILMPNSTDRMQKEYRCGGLGCVCLLQLRWCQHLAEQCLISTSKMWFEFDTLLSLLPIRTHVCISHCAHTLAERIRHRSLGAMKAAKLVSETTLAGEVAGGAPMAWAWHGLGRSQRWFPDMQIERVGLHLFSPEVKLMRCM